MSFNELNSRALIGADNRKRLACYKGSDIYDWGLSSVIVSGGSGASIGSGNLFLTNNHVMGDVGPMARETWFNWHHYDYQQLKISPPEAKMVQVTGLFTSYMNSI
ncbi:hypothetical protein FA893_03800 [Photobacterium damselae subsp. piscicida]|uniref:hypothetical protein n=1 Tax=Photobacterium damselae TaxID=38293 RepID=UPI0002F08FF9|nr:hypothetical protein [Photobacterium damselae]OLQ83392.1 hypothetical protein BEI67_09945 [Photobacterium damselae subsp. piscicida]TFZ54784.1 hypothetical protein E4T25_14095 [Photobacterium damselae subsp. piscicida]TJZ97484.1 hypothetical protein FA893_03800 [Photobacterium damselae subsp. piscicida]BBC41415.1 hypothetical protein PDPE_1-02256 [Photobacterium damselae subsp. piscicida]